MEDKKKSVMDKFFTYSENVTRNLVPNAPGLRKIVPVKEDKFGNFAESVARNTTSSLMNPFSGKGEAIEKANDRRKNLNKEIKKQMDFRF